MTDHSELEEALGYLLAKRPDGWRLDAKVERALLEAERLKWPGLPLPHAMIDFLEYWMIIRKPQSRPASTQGWRQAWRNWCRIERERAEGARSQQSSVIRDQSKREKQPGPPPKRMTELEARERVAEMKERFGWGSGTGTGTGTGTEGGP